MGNDDNAHTFTSLGWQARLLVKRLEKKVAERERSTPVASVAETKGRKLQTGGVISKPRQNGRR